MHIIPGSAMPSEPESPDPALPLLTVPADLGDVAARFVPRTGVLYLNPAAPRADLLRALREAIAYIETGDRGTGRIRRPQLRVVTA